MTREFIELPAFTRRILDGWLTDDELGALQLAIARGVGRIDKVVGLPDLWKVRWRNPRRQRGARGGYRVYFADYAEWRVTVLVLITDKELEKDLSPDQRRTLVKQMRALREQVGTYAARSL